MRNKIEKTVKSSEILVSDLTSYLEEGGTIISKTEKEKIEGIIDIYEKKVAPHLLEKSKEKAINIHSIRSLLRKIERKPKKSKPRNKKKEKDIKKTNKIIKELKKDMENNKKESVQQEQNNYIYNEETEDKENIGSNNSIGQPKP